MAYPRQGDRNDAIVRLKDVEKKSFAQIARIFSLNHRQTAAAIYHREKRRAERLAKEEAQ